MKANFHRLFSIAVIVLFCVLPSVTAASGEYRAKPFCKKHNVPCTLKHRCLAYLGSNASLNYNDGEYYNYVHQGKFYNYISRGKYYAYVDNGTFYNYSREGRLYTTCKPQPGYWQQGQWIVPPPVCE